MDTIWFLHMPRTGGTSIGRYLRKNAGKTYNVDYRGHEKYLDCKKNQLMKKGKVVLITSLRCPVKHTCSLYAITKISKAHKWYDDSNNFNFSDWLRVREKDISNFYYRFWTTQNHNAMDLVKKFDYIFDTASLTVEFNKFIESYGGPKFNIKIRGVAGLDRYVTPEVTKDDRSFIERIRSRDYDLLKSVGFKGI